jgi:SAM-dependent methyltransferase
VEVKAMPEQLFDRAAEYEAMLNQGIGLSGENQEFFIAARIQDMRSRVRSPGRILDFGCGTGKACAYLASIFPEADVVGADLSDDALGYARAHFASDRVTFEKIDDLPQFERFDLCYINGVFHHIAPPKRQQTLAMIRKLLNQGANLALFENNPWNPGTRMVMSRIPFDRDAILLSYVETRRRLLAAGFDVHETRFLFYMPKVLAALRFIEPLFVKVPLGAQYYVLASVADHSMLTANRMN